MKSGNKLLQIEISEAQHRHLKMLAAKRGQSIRGLILGLLTERLHKEETDRG